MSQLPFKLTRKKKKYTKTGRINIVEDVFHNVIQEIEYFRCGLCGKFTAPSKDARCDKCVKQLGLFND